MPRLSKFSFDHVWPLQHLEIWCRQSADTAVNPWHLLDVHQVGSIRELQVARHLRKIETGWLDTSLTHFSLVQQLFVYWRIIMKCSWRTWFSRSWKVRELGSSWVILGLGRNETTTQHCLTWMVSDGSNPLSTHELSGPRGPSRLGEWSSTCRGIQWMVCMYVDLFWQYMFQKESIVNANVVYDCNRMISMYMYVYIMLQFACGYK